VRRYGGILGGDRKYFYFEDSTHNSTHTPHTHPQDKDDMLRELLSLCDGEFLNIDGTWRVGSRVTNVPDCLVFLLGEDAKVHGYGSVTSESKEEMFPLFCRCIILKVGVCVKL